MAQNDEYSDVCIAYPVSNITKPSAPPLDDCYTFEAPMICYPIKMYSSTSEERFDKIDEYFNILFTIIFVTLYNAFVNGSILILYLINLINKLHIIRVIITSFVLYVSVVTYINWNKEFTPPT